jgi:hypothetical protein
MPSQRTRRDLSQSSRCCDNGSQPQLGLLSDF